MNGPQKHFRLEIGAPEQVTILLVGCGGTGSFAALHVAQLAHSVKIKNININLVFVDPDTVEEKNVARQNFCPAEIGLPKAFTLARRYSLAFGLPIIPVVGKFKAKMINEFQPAGDKDTNKLTLIIGCVDNHEARLDIHRAFYLKTTNKDVWWLDSGNHYAHGQILLGNSLHERPQLSPLGFCFALPLPSIQDPDALRPDDGADNPDLSCADLTALDVQSRTINKMMAAWLDVYTERLIVSHDITTMATFIDQRSGMVSSAYIVDGDVIEIKSQPEVASYPEGYPADQPDLCPQCGATLIEGQDVVDNDTGVEAIIFCPDCDWRMLLAEYEERRAMEEEIIEVEEA